MLFSSEVCCIYFSACNGLFSDRPALDTLVNIFVYCIQRFQIETYESVMTPTHCKLAVEYSSSLAVIFNTICFLKPLNMKEYI